MGCYHTGKPGSQLRSGCTRPRAASTGGWKGMSEQQTMTDTSVS